MCGTRILASTDLPDREVVRTMVAKLMISSLTDFCQSALLFTAVVILTPSAANSFAHQEIGLVASKVPAETQLASPAAVSAPKRAAEDVIAYAFAKASPLNVFDDPTLSVAHSERFEYGIAYEVIDRNSQYVKLRRAD